MQWFLITNCQNLSSYHQGFLTKATQYSNELELLSELLGTYKKDLKIESWIEVQRFLDTVLELIVMVHNLPLDTLILTSYYRSMSCCQIALFKSETITDVRNIQIGSDFIEEWFLNSSDKCT
jgi:hypothetical protein